MDCSIFFHAFVVRMVGRVLNKPSVMYQMICGTSQVLAHHRDVFHIRMSEINSIKMVDVPVSVYLGGVFPELETKVKLYLFYIVNG